MSSGVSLDTLLDKQMLDDFVESTTGGICGIIGDRIVNNIIGSKMANHRRSRFTDDQRTIREPASQMAEHVRRSIWYIDANNLYGYAMMQKLFYKDFKFTTISLDYILNTPDDGDHGYYIVCDIDYTNSCKD